MFGEPPVIFRDFFCYASDICLKSLSNSVAVIRGTTDSFSKALILFDLFGQEDHLLPDVGLRDWRSHPLFDITLRFSQFLL